MIHICRPFVFMHALNNFFLPVGVSPRGQ